MPKDIYIYDIEGRLVFEALGLSRKQARLYFSQMMGTRWRNLYELGYRVSARATHKKIVKCHLCQETQ